MECFSSLLLLFCILPVLLMFTYPISIFLFCSCSTLVLLLLVIVASSFCGKKLLAMETTSNRVFHHCVVAPSFCGKKNFLQWRVVRDLVFHHCVVASSSVRKKLLAMEITLVVILRLWWWSLLCSNTKCLQQAKHAIQRLHLSPLSNPGVSHCFVYMPLSLSLSLSTSEYMVPCTQDAMHIPSTPLSLLQSDHTAAAEAAQQSATLDWLQQILSIKEERRSISKSCRYPMPLSIDTFL